MKTIVINTTNRSETKTAMYEMLYTMCNVSYNNLKVFTEFNKNFNYELMCYIARNKLNIDFTNRVQIDIANIIINNETPKDEKLSRVYDIYNIIQNKSEIFLMNNTISYQKIKDVIKNDTHDYCALIEENTHLISDIQHNKPFSDVVFVTKNRFKYGSESITDDYIEINLSNAITTNNMFNNGGEFNG